MSPTKKAVALLCCLGLSWALAAGSRVSWSASPDDEAALLLSWRGVTESVEECREPTEEDLADLPQHMRPERICEEQLPSFRLTLELDSASVLDRVVRPAGARGDRPIYVLERLAVPTGRHRVRLEFSPQDDDGQAVTTPGGQASSIVLDRTLDFRAARVILITRDGDRGGFAVREGDQ